MASTETTSRQHSAQPNHYSNHIIAAITQTAQLHNAPRIRSTSPRATCSFATSNIQPRHLAKYNDMPTYLFALENSPPKRSSLSTTKTRVHDVTTPFTALTTKSCIYVHTTSPHPSILGPTNDTLMTCRNSVVLNFLTSFNIV